MATTPSEWLPILAKRLDHGAARISTLNSYRNGNAPLPEATANVKESWKTFQKESRTNWGELILEAVCDRVVPKGILVDGKSDSDVAQLAQKIWRNNRMDLVFNTWLRDGLACGQSFLTCWSSEDGGVPVITSDSPQSMWVAADPLQPWRVRAALRAWRDIDAGKDFALVWGEQGYQRFSRKNTVSDTITGSVVLTTLVQGTWEPDGDYVQTGKTPPVVVYTNPDGLGEYETCLDLITRINNGVLRRLVIEAMQAFRQRALKSSPDSGGLPQKDEYGNDIDWSELFEPAPGAVWDLPPGLDLWESTPTDTQSLLMACKDDIRQLSAVTRTPLPILMPDNTNTSAAGANAAESGYIARCAARLVEAKIGGEAILVKALEMAGVDLGDQSVELLFEPVERVTLNEKYQAMQMGRAAGQPVQSLEADVLGLSPEQIRQNDIRRSSEAMQALLAVESATSLTRATQPAPQAPQAP